MNADVTTIQGYSPASDSRKLAREPHIRGRSLALFALGYLWFGRAVDGLESGLGGRADR